MALLTVAQVKSFLRIEHTAEDTPLGLWLAMALAQIEAELGRPITSAARTWEDDAKTNRAYGVVDQLIIPVGPIAVDSIAILDADGDTLVVDEDYLEPVDPFAGVIKAPAGICFSNGPYTITADVGLSEAANYSTVIEPMINAAAMDVISDRWHRRNPQATSESAGGGVSTSYDVSEGLPERVKTMLAPWRLQRV